MLIIFFKGYYKTMCLFFVKKMCSGAQYFWHVVSHSTVAEEKKKSTVSKKTVEATGKNFVRMLLNLFSVSMSIEHSPYIPCVGIETKERKLM